MFQSHYFMRPRDYKNERKKSSLYLVQMNETKPINELCENGNRVLDNADDAAK